VIAAPITPDSNDQARSGIYCLVKQCRQEIVKGAAYLLPYTHKGPLCGKHLKIAMQVQHDLPLAIQELLAWSLAYPGGQLLGEPACADDPANRSIRIAIQNAETRVCELRRLEIALWFEP